MALGLLILGLAYLFMWVVRAVPLPKLDVNLIVLNIVQIMVTMAGVVVLANGLVRLWSSWRGSARPPPTPTVTGIDKAKDILAGLVTERWRNEVIENSQPIPVPWRSTDCVELSNHPRLIVEGARTFANFTGDIAKLADDFRALKCQRLIILGGPGTGKTTLAVQLLMKLLETRQLGEPVPVLLSAARWNTKQSVLDWLAECLDQDYPALHGEGLPPGTPKKLVAHSAVLPVLDGLDELPPESLAKILAPLKRAEFPQLIVTCRTAPFAAAVKEVGDVLSEAAVIEPQLIASRVAADHLEACFSAPPPHSWPRILDDLRRGAAPALAKVCSTSRGLWLVRETYIEPREKPDPVTLLDLGSLRDPSALNAHLHDQLIPAVVSAYPPTGNEALPFRPHFSWPAGDIRRWLTYLCHLLTLPGEDTHDVAWWHLARYAPTRLIRLAVGLVCGLVVGIGVDVITTAPVAWAVVIGIVSALVVTLATGSWFEESPGYANFQLRGRASLLIRYLRRGLIVGLLGTLVGLIMSGGTLWYALMIGLISGLGFEFAVGLLAWVEDPAGTTMARSPRSTWQNDRSLTLIRMASGLAIGLMAGVIGWIGGLGPVAVLVGGLVFGLLFGLMLGNHHAWLAYSLTIPHLATTGRLPRRAMDFFDDAYRLRLLRTEGPFYQFRDTELQKHLSPFPAAHARLRKALSALTTEERANPFTAALAELVDLQAERQASTGELITPTEWAHILDRHFPR
ncbi:NACHT domain-containing protein [Streptosporangium sp. G11]|uniref:NACHT domain-containing protein n=1 Tax=Streptosporangium sp. G11 TaxID=3436926 RepID=UPI003EBA8CFD